MSKENNPKRTNWKALATDLGHELDNLTKEFEKLKEQNEVNEHELMKIADQRDNATKAREQITKHIEKQNMKLHAAHHIVDLQRKLNGNITILNRALLEITSIASDMIATFAINEDVWKPEEE